MKPRALFQGRGLLAITASALAVEFSAPDLSKPYAVENGVACVAIEGPLTQKPCFFWDNYESIRARVAAAFADPEVRVVLLDVNSPGGDVAGCFELAAEIRAMASTSGKRLVAFTDGMAASAAYALAASAPEIFVTQTGQVGSIGVINALIDVTALDRAQGLKFSVISSGERKKDGNPHVAITDEAEAQMLANVNALAAIFFAWVNRTRPALSAATLQSFDGALFFGTNAVKVGLANGVTTKSELLATLARAPSASAAGTSEATMADEDKEKKSYEDDMRAKLEEDSKSDDEKKAAAAKKMLAALDADGDDDGDEKKKAEDEKKEADAKAEEEKKDEEAKASASTNANVLARLGKVERENADLKAKAEAGERADILAKRSDLTPSQRDYLASLTLPAMKAALAAFPPPPLDPAAALKATPTRGAGDGDAPRLPPAEANALAAAMGLRTEARTVRRSENEVIFPAMTPDEARAQLQARSAKGGVQ